MWGYNDIVNSLFIEVSFQWTSVNLRLVEVN